MREDLTNSPSNIPQIAEQHITGQLSHLLTYGGSLTGSQASFSRTPLFDNAKQKGGALAKIIHAEIALSQECEGTFYVPRTSSRYILEETANVIYIQSKAKIHSTIHL